MSGKQTEETKTEAKTEAEPSSIEMDLAQVKEQLETLTNFTITTHATAVLSSHSLPIINYQFKRQLANAFAIKGSLRDVEEQLTEKQASYEDLMREKSRLNERNTFTSKYMETALANYRTIADENIALKGNVQKLETELKAKQTLIDNVGEVIKTIRAIAAKKKLPPDILAELKAIISEVPKPLTETITTLEEEREEKGENY